MGKAARSARKDKRAKEKRNKKAAMKAQYATWRDQGMNSKSKRAQRNARTGRKVRAFRVRNRHKRMTPLEIEPVLHSVPSIPGVEPQHQPIGAWLERRYLSWKQAHNTISIKKFLKLRR